MTITATATALPGGENGLCVRFLYGKEAYCTVAIICYPYCAVLTLLEEG